MPRFVLLLALFPVAQFAQTVQTQFFRAILLPTSEVPAVSSTARGVADVTASLVLDSSGQVTSGTVTILAHFTFTAAATTTGLGIWSGNSGQNGALALNSALSTSNSYAVQVNGDSVQQAIQVTSGNATALAALRAMVQNPAGYYVNLLTTANPNGVLRGQLLRAQTIVLMAQMSSANALPAPASAGFGVAQVVAIGTKDATGNWNSAEVYLWATYNSQDQTAFTALQIHPGTSGAVNTASLNPVLPGGLTPMPAGSGSIGPFYMELSVTTAAQTSTFSSLFNNPGSQYIDLRTTGNPQGLMRGQLRHTGSAVLQVPMDSANELHATSTSATAPSALTIYTILNDDGSVAAGSLQADVDYRFSSATQLLGLYLQQAPAGQDGSAVLQVIPDFHSDTGSGNAFLWTAPILDTAMITSLLETPDAWYLDLHTIADPQGAVRGQLAPAPGQAGITAVISADLDKSATTIAPGELVSIFGANLSAVATDLGGFTGAQWPNYLNGLGVTIGGKQARLLYVSPQQINALAPADMPLGPQTVVLGNAAGAIATFTVNVAASAPAIFFYPAPAILKNADFSLVSTANPAKPGDVVLVYCTGLAAGTPASVMIAGSAAPVVYTLPSPGFPGLFQVAVTVPAGLSGNQSLVIQQGGASSNTVMLALK